MFEDRPTASIEYLILIRNLKKALLYSLATCDLSVSDEYLHRRERLLTATYKEEARVMAELGSAASSVRDISSVDE